MRRPSLPSNQVRRRSSRSPGAVPARGLLGGFTAPYALRITYTSRSAAALPWCGLRPAGNQLEVPSSHGGDAAASKLPSNLSREEFMFASTLSDAEVEVATNQVLSAFGEEGAWLGMLGILQRAVGAAAATAAAAAPAAAEPAAAADAASGDESNAGSPGSWDSEESVVNAAAHLLMVAVGHLPFTETLSKPTQETIKAMLLRLLSQAGSGRLRSTILRITTELAKNLIPEGEWRTVPASVMLLARDKEPSKRELALCLVRELARTLVTHTRELLAGLVPLMRRMAKDSDLQVRVAVVEAMAALLRVAASKANRTTLKPLAPDCVDLAISIVGEVKPLASVSASTGIASGGAGGATATGAEGVTAGGGGEAETPSEPEDERHSTAVRAGQRVMSALAYFAKARSSIVGSVMTTLVSKLLIVCLDKSLAMPIRFEATQAVIEVFYRHASGVRRRNLVGKVFDCAALLIAEGPPQRSAAPEHSAPKVATSGEAATARGGGSGEADDGYISSDAEFEVDGAHDDRALEHVYGGACHLIDTASLNYPTTAVLPPLRDLFRRVVVEGSVEKAPKDASGPMASLYRARRKRWSRHAAAVVTIVGMVAEGCRDAMEETFATDWLPLLLPLLQHRSVKVRAAACSTVKHWADNLTEVIPMYRRSLLDAVVPLMKSGERMSLRVHAAGAVEGLCATLTDTEVKPYIAWLVDVCVGCIREDDSSVQLQCQAMAVLAALAVAGRDQLKDHFVGKLDGIVLDCVYGRSLKRTVDRDATSSEAKPPSDEDAMAAAVAAARGHQDLSSDQLALRAKAMYLMGHLARSVGEDDFKPYFAQLMSAAVGGLKLKHPSLTEHSFFFFGNVACVKGASFAPFLPAVVPTLLEACQNKSVSDDLRFLPPGGAEMRDAVKTLPTALRMLLVQTGVLPAAAVGVSMRVAQVAPDPDGGFDDDPAMVATVALGADEEWSSGSEGASQADSEDDSEEEGYSDDEHGFEGDVDPLSSEPQGHVHSSSQHGAHDDDDDDAEDDPDADARDDELRAGLASRSNTRMRSEDLQMQVSAVHALGLIARHTREHFKKEWRTAACDILRSLCDHAHLDVRAAALLTLESMLIVVAADCGIEMPTDDDGFPDPDERSASRGADEAASDSEDAAHGGAVAAEPLEPPESTGGATGEANDGAGGGEETGPPNVIKAIRSATSPFDPAVPKDLAAVLAIIHDALMFIVHRETEFEVLRTAASVLGRSAMLLGSLALHDEFLEGLVDAISVALDSLVATHDDIDAGVLEPFVDIVIDTVKVRRAAFAPYWELIGHSMLELARQSPVTNIQQTALAGTAEVMLYVGSDAARAWGDRCALLVIENLDSPMVLVRHNAVYLAGVLATAAIESVRVYYGEILESLVRLVSPRAGGGGRSLPEPADAPIATDSAGAAAAGDAGAEQDGAPAPASADPDAVSATRRSRYDSGIVDNAAAALARILSAETDTTNFPAEYAVTRLFKALVDALPLDIDHGEDATVFWCVHDALEQERASPPRLPEADLRALLPQLREVLEAAAESEDTLATARDGISCALRHVEELEGGAHVSTGLTDGEGGDSDGVDVSDIVLDGVTPE